MGKLEVVSLAVFAVSAIYTAVALSTGKHKHM